MRTGRTPWLFVSLLALLSLLSVVADAQAAPATVVLAVEGMT